VTQAHAPGTPLSGPDTSAPAAGQSRPAGRKRRPAARGPRPKHVPQRTCVACRQIEGKRRLIRIVRTPAGTVEVDATGKKNGRGAYLHADPSCWESALKRKALQHALKTELSDSDRAGLDAFRAGLAPVAGKDEDRHE
jgi:predicted RNA-binding protein YlxR (DUF448 family)